MNITGGMMMAAASATGHTIHPEDLRKALTAALALAPQVKVRDLVWSPVGSGRWRAQAPIGSYEIWHQWASDGKFHVSVHTGPYTDLVIGSGFPELEAAKSAVQADYTARIMSALETNGHE